MESAPSRRRLRLESLEDRVVLSTSWVFQGPAPEINAQQDTVNVPRNSSLRLIVSRSAMGFIVRVADGAPAASLVSILRASSAVSLLTAPADPSTASLTPRSSVFKRFVYVTKPASK